MSIHNILKPSLVLVFALLAYLPFNAVAEEPRWRCDVGPVTQWCKPAREGLDGRAKETARSGVVCLTSRRTPTLPQHS